MPADLTNARILAIETSGPIGSVALAQGDKIIAAQSFTATLRHSVQLIPTIDTLCKTANWTAQDIQYLFVSAGPGSFTALRVGITFARTLAQAADCLLVAVPTVDVIAQNIRPMLAEQAGPIHIAVILDAKRSELYAAAFKWESSTLTKIIPEQVISPANLLEQLPKPLWLIGQGIDYHRPALAQPALVILDQQYWPPQARNVHACGMRLARQGRFVQLENLVPIYLRLPHAQERYQQRSEPNSPK